MSLFKRKPSAEESYGIGQYEFNKLAVYNGEVARGLIHTDAWKRRMGELQSQFDSHRESNG